MSIVIQAEIEPWSSTKSKPCDHDSETYSCDAPIGDDGNRDGSRCNASMAATESFCFTWDMRKAHRLSITVGADSYNLSSAEIRDLVKFFDSVRVAVVGKRSEGES